MSDDSKRRPGRKPYNGVIVRADVSEPGDEAVGQWSHAQLVRMDNRFRQPIQRAFHRDRRPASGSAVASTGLENIANRIDPPPPRAASSPPSGAKSCNSGGEKVAIEITGAR